MVTSKSRESSLWEEFGKLEETNTQNNIKKKAIILEIASIYENRFNHDSVFVNSIASIIIRLSKKHGYAVSQSWVYDILPDKYKQIKLEQSSSRTFRTGEIYDNKDLEEFSIYKQQRKEALKILKYTDWSIFSREEIYDVVPKTKQIYVEQTSIVKDEKLDDEVLDELEKQPTFDSIALDPFRHKIQTDKPETRINALGSSMMKLAKAYFLLSKSWESASKKANEFPLDKYDPREEKWAKIIEDNAKFIQMCAAVVKPATDLKYKRSVSEWVDIAHYEKIQGKHASASKNEAEGIYKNPDTGEWVRAPRKLTREQVGDRAQTIRKFGNLFKEFLPTYYIMEQWYIEKMKPYAVGLSVKLGPKLSNRA
ncbi:MAG: hypothetical protein ACPKPY_05500 [Nitrososphaeraceae archaeon]